MIFIKKDQTSIWIRKHYRDNQNSPYKLCLTHKLTSQTVEFEDLEDKDVNSGYWIFYHIDFRDLQSGEYEYTLFNNYNTIMETGLLQVATDLADPITYNAQKTKIQYGR